MLQDDDDGEGDSGKEENTQAGDEGSEEPDNEKNEPSNEGNIEETVINQAVNLQADNPNENYQDLPGPMLDFDEGSVDDPFTVEQFYQQLTKNQYSSSQRQRPWPPRVTVGGSNDNEDSDGEKEMGDAGDDPGPWNPLGGGGGDGGEETDSYQKDIELSEKDLDATPPSDSEETDEVSARKDTPEGVSPSGPASSGTEPVRVSSLDAGAHPWESIRNPRGVTENLGAN